MERGNRYIERRKEEGENWRRERGRGGKEERREKEGRKKGKGRKERKGYIEK